jgi:thiamine-phosphate pyrophosphorylase
MPLNLSKPILYLITPGVTTEATTSDSPEFAQVLNQISVGIAARLDLIQIREKQLSARVLFQLVAAASTEASGAETRILVNDRADIAAGAGAHGVHLPAQSLRAATIRKTFGANFLIGASTHSLDEARDARDEGADFVVFGPVFTTKSKQAFGPPQGLETLSHVAQALAEFPVVALGGISITNARDCLAAGARGIAGIGLFQEPAEIGRVCSIIRDVPGKQ